MASTKGLQLFDIGWWGQALATVGLSTPGTNSAGGIYVAPKTGNIRSIGFSLSASSVGGTLEGRLETVTSSRVPSGTLQGTNTNNATITSPSANVFSWFAFTADGAVTAGDLVAAVVKWVVTANVTLNYSLNRSVANGPYAVLNTGSWATTQQPPCVCLKYDDGTIIDGGLPCSALGLPGYKSSTNPNERACVFTPQFDCTLKGAKVPMQPDNAASTWTLGLYTGTSTTPTATALVPANYAGSLFNENIVTVNFSSPVSLTSGQQYRLACLATNASNNINTYNYTFPSTAERDMVMGAATSDTRNGGAWIGENTNKSELICPVIDSVTVSSTTTVISRFGGGLTMT